MVTPAGSGATFTRALPGRAWVSKLKSSLTAPRVGPPIAGVSWIGASCTAMVDGRSDCAAPPLAKIFPAIVDGFVPTRRTSSRSLPLTLMVALADSEPSNGDPGGPFDPGALGGNGGLKS